MLEYVPWVAFLRKPLRSDLAVVRRIGGLALIDKPGFGGLYRAFLRWALTPGRTPTYCNYEFTN